jgi:hypothetical protein
LDTGGNIALASQPYATAQDVASAIRTFQGECWYNTALGIPYFAQILGELPPISLVKAQFVAAAETVPDVNSAVCYISSFQNRDLQGQVQTTIAGSSAVAVATISPTQPGGPFILGESSLGGLNEI